MIASLHILDNMLVEQLLAAVNQRIRRLPRANSYLLAGMLDSLASNEIDQTIPGDAFESVWVCFDTVCDLKLRELASVTPALELGKLDYRFVYSVPHLYASKLLDQIESLAIEEGHMRWLISETRETDGQFSPSEINRALDCLRRAIEKITPNQLGILWLRVD
jgi:hypothetical protein